MPPGRSSVCSIARGSGFPRHYFQGSGGIGDDLLCTTAFHELRQRKVRGIVFATQYPGLFRGSPDLDAVIDCPRPRLGRWLREGLPFVRLGYAHYDPATDQDEPLTQHVLIKICRVADLGADRAAPLFISDFEEVAAGRLAENQMVIQTSALAAAHAIRNKEWFPDRFQAVCDYWRARHTVIQIGSLQDPPLAGAKDLRGQTSLRQSAAILANASVFMRSGGISDAPRPSCGNAAPSLSTAAASVRGKSATAPTSTSLAIPPALLAGCATAAIMTMCACA